MNRKIKFLVKKQRRQHRRQLFDHFFNEKLKKEREFNSIYMGAMLGTKVGLFCMALDSTSMIDHIAELNAIDYACKELNKRRLL